MRVARSVILAVIVVAIVYVAHRPLFLCAANLLASFGEYSSRVDIPYDEHSGNTLDVYAPNTTHTRRPIVIFVHGGGWRQGDKDLYKFVGVSLVKQGYIAVVPNYRLYPQVKFPVFVQDVANAIVWTRLHAAEWNGNERRIYLVGHSAGAHLAMLVALNDRYLKEAGGSTEWISGVVGLSGPYEFVSYEVFSPHQIYEEALPIKFARAGAPPILILHGMQDRVADLAGAKHFVAAVNEAGGQIEVKYFENAQHNDLVNALSPIGLFDPPVMEAINNFIATR